MLFSRVIKKKPEAIKYIETRPLEGRYSLDIPQNEFFDLARLALNYGYIPIVDDIEQNPRLADSFDIMKELIQEKPELINMIRSETPNQEELLKIAIDNGFNDNIAIRYMDGHSSANGNELLSSETAIKYQLKKHKQLNDNVRYRNDYSTDLYNYLICKGYQTKDIINLFNGNFDIMKKIISHNPEYITSLSTDLSRKEIDELSLLSFEKGYIPKFEDEIFGHGAEAAKIMVRKFPSYLEKVKLLDSQNGFLIIKPNEIYDDICKIAVDAGFISDIKKMGNGYDGSTTIIYNSSYDIMKKAIPLKPDLIECCSVIDKEKYDELCRLALSCGYDVTNEYALTH